MTQPNMKGSAAKRPWLSGVRRSLRISVMALGILLALAAIWEGYKAVGSLTGDRIPFTDVPLPISSKDSGMPHIWTIFQVLGEPVNAATDQTMLSYYLTQSSITLREALYGLLAGSLVGVLLALVMSEIPFLSRGMMPWLVVSQAVPLVAIAPIIVIWVGGMGFDTWVGVTVITAYLSFFPVLVNTLSGLNSPDPVQAEFMRSIAASRMSTLLKLRLPSALPNIFSGLRLAATASVMGAIVGELAAGGSAVGIGKGILTAAYYFTIAPTTLFAAVLIASLTGVLFVQVVALVEWTVLRKRSR